MIRKLYLLYYSTAVFAVFSMNLYNVSVDGSTLRHIFRFDVYFVTGSVLLFVYAIRRFTRFRLSPVEETLAKGASPVVARHALHRLLGFPGELFRAVLAGGVLISIAYHGIELFLLRARDFDELVLRHLIVEQAFAWTLAFVYLAAARWLLRPYYSTFQAQASFAAQQQAKPMRSFVRLWTGAFAAGLALIAIPQIWFVRNELLENEQPSMAVTIGIGLLGMAVAGAIMALLLHDFRKEIRGLSHAMKAMTRLHPGQLRTLPVAAMNEIGELTDAVARLHAKAANAREAQREDLELAAALQRMLLPEEKLASEGIRIRRRLYAAREVGGAICDYMSLRDGRVALALGEVSEAGAAGALMMGAATLLLRTELRAGGSPGEVLTRLNASIYETVGGESLVSLGLVMLDPRTGEAWYAGAGHNGPLIRCGDSTRLAEQPGLPLGAKADTVYANVEWRMNEGDWLLLYSAGVAEQFRVEGQTDGFASLLAFAASRPGLSGEELAAEIWTRDTSSRRMRSIDRALLVADMGRTESKLPVADQRGSAAEKEVAK